MSRDEETLRVYDAKAGEYAKLVGAEENSHLSAFIAALPKGAHVLDLGCGPGNSAALMAAAGLTVEATDASAEMIALAAQHPGVTARVASFDEIAGTDVYDGIWANFSLLHAERADMPRHLAALKTALKPGGLFHIGMKTGTGAHRDGIGRFYTYYSEAELHGLLETAGFTPFAKTTGEEMGLAGTVDPWVVFSARG